MKRSVLVGLLLLIASFSYGVYPVQEVGANLMQNTVTAMKQVAAYAQQVQQYQTQLLQYKNQLLNTVGLSQASQIWQSAQQTMGGVMGAVNMFRGGGGIEGYVNQFKDVNYWLSSSSPYTYQTSGSLLQKQANDAMVKGILAQQDAINKDAANLERLQRSAGSTTGQKQAIDAANQLAALEQQQLLQIRSILIQEQQALAARNGTVSNDESQRQAATQKYFGIQLGDQPHTGW